jgi:hypothetical protein
MPPRAAIMLPPRSTPSGNAPAPDTPPGRPPLTPKPPPNAPPAPNAGLLAGAPNAGVLAAPNPPNDGVLAGAPNAGVDIPNGELEAPNAGALEAPNAGALETPNAGVLAGAPNPPAPNAGVLDAPNAGVLAPNAGWAGVQRQRGVGGRQAVAVSVCHRAFAAIGARGGHAKGWPAASLQPFRRRTVLAPKGLAAGAGDPNPNVPVAGLA